MRGGWPAEHILIGLAGGRLPRRTSLGPSPLSALARDFLAAGAGRMVLVQPNDPPSPAGGNPTLPAAYGPTSLRMDQGMAAAVRSCQ